MAAAEIQNALQKNPRIPHSFAIHCKAIMIINGERPFAILTVPDEDDDDKKFSVNHSVETLVMNSLSKDSTAPKANEEEEEETTAMGLSRPTRLLVLSSFTFTYFLVELVVGYAAGSIALVADSFHMVRGVSSPSRPWLT